MSENRRMKKVLILLFYFYSIVAFCSSQIEFQDVNDVKVQNYNFFPVKNDFLIPKYSKSWSKLLWDNEGSKGWRSINTDLFSDIGISKGKIVQYISGSKLKSYAFKEKLNVYFIPKGEMVAYNSDYPPFRTIYILLKDDIKEVEIPEGLSSGDSPNGNAYIGTEFVLQSQANKEIKETSVPVNNPEIQKIIKDFNIYTKKFPDLIPFTPETVKIYQYNGFSFYRIQGYRQYKDNKSPGVGLLLKISGNKFLNFSDVWQNTDYSPSSFNFNPYTGIKDVDWAIYLPDSGMHNCYEIILSKKGQVQRIKFECDSGGC